MRKIKLTIVILLSISLNYAQSVKEQLKLVNSVKLENTEFFQEVDFQDKFGYFIIPVKIGDDTYQYIFDTGGYNTLTSEIMAKNELPNLMEVETGSSNQIKNEDFIYNKTNIEMKYNETIEEYYKRINDGI